MRDLSITTALANLSLKVGLKCSFTPVNSAFSPTFASSRLRSLRYAEVSMKQKFNFDEVLAVLQSAQPISGKDGILAPLVKRLTEAALEAELDNHLAQEMLPDRKIGKYLLYTCPPTANTFVITDTF